jgi:archaellum component FlaC
MDADQKAELLEKIDGKVEAMTTRIEASDDTDAEKATKIERITGMIEMIKSFLS